MKHLTAILMKHLTAILIKYLMFTLILYLTMVLFFGLSLTSVLLLSPVLAIGSYLIVDILVLKAAGNFFTAIIDFSLVFIIIWGYGRYFTEPVYTWSLATVYSSFLIAGGESFLHKYLINPKLKKGK